jgi:serine protease AprX
MEKSKVFLIAVFSLVLTINSQTTFPKKYFVKFTDKTGSGFSISNPSAFLSAKAIARRAKNTYPITLEDVPVNANYLQGVSNAGGQLFARSKWYNGVVTVINSQTDYNAIAALPYVQNLTKIALRTKSQIPVAKFNVEEQTVQLINKNVISSKLNSTDKYQYGQSFNQVDMLGGVCMHNKGFDGAGTTIVILDSGFENADIMTAFDSARNQNRILSTYDFVDMNTSVYTDHNHGANVFSCIGANVPNTMIGTAPQAKFHLCRTEDVFTEYPIEEYNWVSGLEYADSVGADVVNSSLGYTNFDDPIYNHVYGDLNGRTSPASNATSLAARRGIVVCNSAGNEGNNTWKYIGVPADGDSMLAVGSVNSNKVRSGFSSKGPTADGRIKPDVAAQGGGTFLAYTNGTNVFGGSSGTSFSSPLMTGMVACLIQAHPNAKAMQIINAVKQSSHQFSNPDSLLGYGIPNFCKADSLLSFILKLSDKNTIVSNSIQVYPNPFNETLQIAVQSTLVREKIKIKMYDVIGKLIRTEEVFSVTNKNNIHLNTSELNKGIYMIKVEFADQSKHVELIKQ